MPNIASDIFRQAVALNLQDARRRGNIVDLEPGDEMIVAGDIHGNRLGLARIIEYAALGRKPQRRLLLQEIIHGPIDPTTGHDRSVELLLRAARLKISNPQQVLFLLSNHDIAQVTGNEIMKEGRGYCRAFEAGVAMAFPQDAGDVLAAMKEFFLSMPIAARCPGRVWVSHSVPSPSRMKLAGTEVLSRPYRVPDDLNRGGALEWVWGRDQTPQQLDALAAELGVEFFILGHKHLDVGYEVISPHAIVLNSDHAGGSIAHLSCDKGITADMTGQFIKQIAALGQTR